MNEWLYSVIIPAYNEEENIEHTVDVIAEALTCEKIPHEIIVVNDNSTDETRDRILALMDRKPVVRIVDRTPPGGFGRAVRGGIAAARGDVVTICMADSSDDPRDVVAYYRKLEEGYDCVFGSRFIHGAHVENYPLVKLVVNRIVNRCIKMLFRCRFNDLTNAFKAYRMDVIQTCGPYRSSHFNITLELSLSALIRNYHIAQIPIHWYGRTWGSSNLSLRTMGRRYLEVLLKAYAEKVLIADDLEAEKLAGRKNAQCAFNGICEKMTELERRLERVEGRFE